MANIRVTDMHCKLIDGYMPILDSNLISKRSARPREDSQGCGTKARYAGMAIQHNWVMAPPSRDQIGQLLT
jgi:hypothetical protein